MSEWNVNCRLAPSVRFKCSNISCFLLMGAAVDYWLQLSAEVTDCAYLAPDLPIGTRCSPL